MVIHFNHLHIENFKSIGEADIDLGSRGIVTVVGINNYEDNVNSNGSGKSSIFSALFWALYGKTSEGISNPANRYSNGRCLVSVSLTVDNIHYDITRSVKSSQEVKITANESEISCRNRSDSDKYIKDSIIGMTSDVFLSLVYLSQGFGSRLSLLTPSGRKDRIESLVNTAVLIDQFGNKFQSMSADKSGELKLAESEYNRLLGQQQSYINLSNDIERKISEAKQYCNFFEFNDKKYYSSDIPALQQDAMKISEEVNSVRGDICSVDGDYNSYSRQQDRAHSAMKSLMNEVNKDKSLISHANRGICPTCNQAITKGISESLKQDAQQRLDANGIKLNEYKCEFDRIDEYLLSISEKLEGLKLKLNQLQQQYSNIQRIIRSIPSEQTINIDDLVSQSTEYTNRASSLNDNILDIQKKVSICEHEIEVIAHCRQLISKSFRTYLLKNAIDFMNSRLAVYSKMLFSNDSDVVSVCSDSQKLDILLGDSSYESLSGGEQRRVDIPIMLAQRDLASEVAGVSSNVLILDEILESMDEKATQVTLDLLEQQSRNVESMFIISHNQYSLPADSSIIVEKGSNRIASVIDKN